MQTTEKQQRDLTLSPNSYLYLQSEAKSGAIQIHRGPTVVNQTGQDVPIKYDAKARKFSPCSLDQAVQLCPLVSEGDYVIIENPSPDGSFPSETSQPSKPLEHGRKIVLPGPWSEALYPGQAATVIEGHRMRSNQFIVAMIYEAAEAKKNWQGIVAEVQQAPNPDEMTDEQKAEAEKSRRQIKSSGGLPTPESFAVGTRIVIRGSDVSFFIPCTGVEVLLDDDGNYIREAVTLEQMEYAALRDESGKKEYPRGPAVVFPSPTQVFEQDSKKRRKFRPTELNTINGIHLKVTADFEDDDMEKVPGADGKRPTREYKEGEELFVTGKTLAIYYPREELRIIEYGQGNKKHFSTAIPKGKGRYVIDRTSGKIRIERGYAMYLANPITEIPVKRVLTREECELWYPGNAEAVAFNEDLAGIMAASPSGRSGMISEGDYRKGMAKRSKSASRGGPSAAYLSADQSLADAGSYEASLESAYQPEAVSDSDAGGSIKRGTRYTEPRSLTLNDPESRFQGVPVIECWPGYAVLVVGAEGSRKVVEGPEVYLLEYDEKLGFMTLSTSKPKSTDNLFRTAYLQTKNNQVGDIISFESKDHVKGQVKISMRVTFEGDTEDEKLRWFSVENYVKYLTDHVRSIIGGMAKRNPIADIKSDYVDLVRDAILGNKKSRTGDSSEPLGDQRQTSRKGLYFEDNGMRVIEVEVLDLTLGDHEIEQMLNEQQTNTVRTNIELEEARATLKATKEKQSIQQETLEAQNQTEQKRLELEAKLIEDRLVVTLAQVDAELKKIEEDKKTTEAKESLADMSFEAQRARSKAENAQLLEEQTAEQKLKVELLNEETKAAAVRLEAAKDGLGEVLVALGRDDMAVRLAEAMNIERFITGDDSPGNAIANVLSFAPALQEFFNRGTEIAKARPDKSNRLRQTADTQTS